MDFENVLVKIKPAGQPIAHQKAYEIDGELLRTGSANFTSSGLRKQDNDLIVVRDPAIVSGFEKNFEVEWSRP